MKKNTLKNSSQNSGNYNIHLFEILPLKSHLIRTVRQYNPLAYQYFNISSSRSFCS